MSVTASYRVVGRYLMCEAFASGGMASVHLGRLLGGEGFSRTVAIKQLYAHFARDEEFVHMFLGEARLLSRIRHPHVVAPLDVLRLGSELFIIMEYVHGESLARLAEARRGPLSLRIASGILQQTLLGLHAAHEATDENGAALAIVHRDVSPQNILVDAHGSVRVVDFGIAKATSQARTTQEGHLKGKPGYLAPEQLRFEAADRRTDVFNAGIVLWELLSGERLFSNESPRAALERVTKGEVPAPSRANPEVPPALDAVVARALCGDRERRFQTAREMALALMDATSSAAPLEIGSWVEGSMSDVLRRREQAIAAMELISPSDLTQVLVEPRGLGGSPAKPASAPPVAHSHELRSEPIGAMLVSPRPAPRLIASLTPLATTFRTHSGSLLLSAVLTIALLFAYDAMFRPSAAPTSPEHRLQANESTAPSPAAAPPVAAPPLATPAAASLPVAPPATTAPTNTQERTRKSVRPDRKGRATAATAPTANATPAPSGREQKPSHPCRESDLYTIDANGVKRWKKDRPECYTWASDKGTK
jgi:eukaryotic-like serine/threonine-protein kinase